MVGGTLVLGKHFQLLCYSDNGTLPITYNLHGPDKKIQQRVVSKPGEHAIFNSSAIYKIADLNNFICHVTNSQQRAPMVATGDQMLRSTKIIGVFDAGIMTTHSNIQMLTWSNIYFTPCRACVNTSVDLAAQLE